MLKFITGMPSKFDIAERNVAMEGAIIEADDMTGRAIRITRVREFLD
jgi:calcineurin-like phosphoesterase